MMMHTKRCWRFNGWRVKHWVGGWFGRFRRLVIWNLDWELEQKLGGCIQLYISKVLI